MSGIPIELLTLFIQIAVGVMGYYCVKINSKYEQIVIKVDAIKIKQEQQQIYIESLLGIERKMNKLLEDVSYMKAKLDMQNG